MKNTKLRKAMAITCAFVMTAMLAIPTGGFGLGTTAYAATTSSSDGDAFYDFRDGSIIPTNTAGNTNVTYGALTVLVGTSNAYAYNGTQHGVQFKAGNSVQIAVSGPAKISVGDCQYSNMTSMTLTSADGTYTQTVDSRKGCYDPATGAYTVDFTYKGETATTLTLAFTDTAYVPCIKVTSLHKAYNLANGSILTQNQSAISTPVTYGSLSILPGSGTFYWNDATHGAALSSANSVQLQVAGATKVSVGQCQYSSVTSMTMASADGAYTETLPVIKSCSDPLEFKYTGADPTTLTLTITGSGTAYMPYINIDPIFEEVGDANGAVKDSVMSYNFSDGSVVPTTYDSVHKLTGSLTSADNMLTVTGAGDLYWHDKQHGLALYGGNTFAIKVAGDATVTFNLCEYGADATATVVASSKKGLITSAKSQLLKGTQTDGLSQITYTYTGVATTLLFTVKTAAAVNEMYLHGINVSNLPAAQTTPTLVGNGKTDVWDLGAEQLDSSKYNNMLTTDIMNSWYPSTVTVGSTGATIGSFATSDICFNAAGYVNNRLRTSNTAITRYDTRTDLTVGDTTLKGYVYSNNTTPSIFFGVKAYKNDILTVYAGSNGGDSTIYCQSPSGSIQVGQTGGAGAKLTFSASEYGMYKIYTINEKLVIYRVERSHTQPVLVSGNVDITEAAGIASKDYRIVFTNKETGEAIEAQVNSGKYSTYLNQEFNYSVTLKDANGYVIKTANTIALAKGSATTSTFDVAIKAVDLVTMTGEITGLSADALAKLKLSFVNTNMLYVPEFTVNGTTIVAKLERGVTYTLNALNINDYFLSDITTVAKTADSTQNIAFALKPTHTVNLSLANLPTEAAATATVTFTNINESGYKYTFNIADIATTPIKLRDGQYKAVVKGTGSAAYIQALTSDVKVAGADVAKTITFNANTSWDFSKYNGNPGIETINSNKYYLGLKLSANLALENKIYLLVNAGVVTGTDGVSTPTNGTVDIPVKAGNVVTISYCYAASFSVNNVTADTKTVTCTSGSTTQIDSTQFIAAADGYVTLTASGTSYLTSIVVSEAVAYSDKVTVGKDKQCKTINEALSLIAKMSRPNGERVQIVVDPGNYEEQIVISIPNISIVNAAGNNSSIEVKNKGVDIADNAVRITSYYGHGYNYYSMSANSKYSEETLAVNKENGYLTVANTGSGTNNGSYWNATAIVSASGFQADGIIFENSYNQYISAKEAADTVVQWATGSKGLRPVTYGDTSVQSKSFVERAAAIAITGDQSVFTGCKFIGRQDTLYGGTGVKSLFEKCDILGGTDYIFGGITAVFYQCNLVMNTDNAVTSDVAYITAAQQSGGRGYLMYNCNITSTTPGIDTASTTRSKAGYFGRPWAANTSEVVFYKTTVETTDYTAQPSSLLASVGWLDTLGGQSVKMYEYGTMEVSGVDTTSSRASWAPVLSTPVLTDGTPITVAAFLGDWATTLQVKGLALDLADSALINAGTVVGTQEERLAAYNALSTVIISAEAIKKADYSADSAAALTTAITTAKALTKTSAVSSIVSATAALNAAVSGMVMLTADYSALNTAIAKAEALDSSIYTAESFAAVTSALTSAKSVSTDLKLDGQATVNSAAAALNSAITTLVKTVIASEGNSEAKIIDNSAVIPTGATFAVEPVVSGKIYDQAAAVVAAAPSTIGTGISQFVVYEMNLTSATNTAISQLTGKISITIPAPATLDLTKTITVFRVETNATLTKLDTKVVDGNIVFETDHFSTYVVAQVADVTVAPTTPAADTSATAAVTVQTSDSTNLFLYVILLLISCAAGFGLISSKKKEMIK